MSESRRTTEYKAHPPLAAYIDRIGAEELNFRKFIVREWTERQNGRRYYIERALIEISADGEVTCSDPAYEPTTEERDNIKLVVKGAAWPTPIAATAAGAESQRIKLKLKKEFWFVCYDRARKGVLWCQERREKETRDKDYYPWTFWSDDKWRRMEPDGPLPFWKPQRRRYAAGIMIHEGAKAARYVDWLVGDPEDVIARAAMQKHPWGEKLGRYEHWGMMGGALSPHRADYDEIRAEKPGELVYVCDRDDPGEAALQKVSRKYRGPLIGVKFDTRWETGWDLADEMPKELFKERDGIKHYIGPSLDELMVPATWATDIILIEKRPKAVLRQQFRDEWIHSVTPEAFINKRTPSRIYYKASEFNNRVRPYSEASDTAEELKKDDKGKVETLTYSPALPSGIVAGTPRAFNTHQPSAIKPTKGSPWPFLRYMTHLFPDKSDRIEVMRWVATLIAKPEIKILYGLLMVSEAQGVGKSTLGEQILKPLLGEQNVSFPSESAIVDSEFNTWKAHRRLAFVHEIYAGGTPRAYNKLKSVITDKTTDVNEKFVAKYQIENWCHVAACSNSLRALKLPGDDRRWLVPKVTENLRPRSYWISFNRWLETGGLGIIRQWAENFAERNSVQPADHAPDSSAKRQMVEDAYSQGQTIVANFLDHMKSCADKTCSCEGPCQAGRPDRERGEPAIVTDKALVELIRNRLYDGRHSDKLESGLTVRKIAKDRGWKIGKKDEFVKTGVKGRVISTSGDLAAKTPAELRKDGWRIIDEAPV